jgi:hypothetical protein
LILKKDEEGILEKGIPFLFAAILTIFWDKIKMQLKNLVGIIISGV